MSIADAIGPQLPYLRRYARALTGDQRSGDNFVRATLEAALADDVLRASLTEGRTALYKAFHKIWHSAHVQLGEGAVEASDRDSEVIAHDRLSRIPPVQRQALLLDAIEDFSHDEIEQVLELQPGHVAQLIASAIAEIDGETRTEVLIIEDESLIAMQLEDLVTDLGHTVTGMATTRSEAVAMVGENKPGLVLADIQLADGSSGIDAVQDILAQFDVPVIFITAYPERLLSGDRPEPTYLITKPFREASVQAAISQALFFGNTRAL